MILVRVMIGFGVDAVDVVAVADTAREPGARSLVGSTVGPNGIASPRMGGDSVGASWPEGLAVVVEVVGAIGPTTEIETSSEAVSTTMSGAEITAASAAACPAARAS